MFTFSVGVPAFAPVRAAAFSVPSGDTGLRLCWPASVLAPDKNLQLDKKTNCNGREKISAKGIPTPSWKYCCHPRVSFTSPLWGSFEFLEGRQTKKHSTRSSRKSNSAQDLPPPPTCPDTAGVRSSRVLKLTIPGTLGDYPGDGVGEPPTGNGKKNLERNGGGGKVQPNSIYKTGPGFGACLG